jgi:hypothetical protein
MELGEHDWANVALAVGFDRNVCRVHWTEALGKLNTSKRWTENEERQLLWLVAEKKAETIPWSFIAKSLGTNRTPKQVQYKYRQLLKRNEESVLEQLEQIGETLQTRKILLNPVIPVVEDRDSDHSDDSALGSYWLTGTW